MPESGDAGLIVAPAAGHDFTKQRPGTQDSEVIAIDQDVHNVGTSGRSDTLAGICLGPCDQ